MWGDKRKLKMIDTYYQLKTMDICEKVKNKFLRDEMLDSVAEYRYYERNVLVRDVLRNPSIFSFSTLKTALEIINGFEKTDRITRGENGKRK